MHNNYRVILRTIGLVLIFEGIAMLVPLAYAVWLDDASATAFLHLQYSALVSDYSFTHN